MFKKVDNDNEIPTERVSCICLPAVVIGSAFNSHKHYFLRALLEECEQKTIKRKIKSIVNDLESSSDEDSSDDDDDDDDDDNNSYDEKDDSDYHPHDDDNYPSFFGEVMIL